MIPARTRRAASSTWPEQPLWGCIGLEHFLDKLHQHGRRMADRVTEDS